MSLLTKRLMALQPGTEVEVTIIDSSYPKILGTVNENDFEESLEIISGADSFIFNYSDIKSVRIVNSASTVSTSAPSAPAPAVAPPPAQSAPQPVQPAATPVVEDAPSPKLDLSKSGLSYICDVEIHKPADKLLEELFKALPIKDKKIANSAFQSYMAKLKSNDLSQCQKIVDRFADNLEDAEASDKISEKSWQLATLMAIRCGHQDMEYFCLISKRYDLLAILFHKKGKTEKAVAYACGAIAANCFSDNKDIIYTIISYGSLSLKDMSGVCSVLSNYPDAFMDTNMYDFIKYVYRTNNGSLPQSISAARIVDYLNSRYDAKEVSKIIADNELISSSAEDQNDEDYASEVNGYGQVKNGIIAILSWSTATGTILSDDDENFSFKYEDISDPKLKSKVDTLYQRDLKAINKEIPVSFETLGDKAVNILPKKSSSPPRPASTPVHETAPVESAPATAEENLECGRLAIGNTHDENRFAKAYKYFEKAVELSEGKSGVSDFIGCSLPLYNLTSDYSYLEKAYSAYEKYDKSVPGLSGNTTILDLLFKMDKKDEALPVVDRILADPKISVETRLSYILHRANILFFLAETEKENDPNLSAEHLESSKTTYLDWEQRYLERPEIYSKSSFKKIYHNTVLFSLAKCFAEKGENEEAKKILERIIGFDASNEFAQNLLKQISSSEQNDNDGEAFSQDSDENGIFRFDDYLFDDEEDEEELVQVYEYEDVSGWEALGIYENDAVEYLFNLKARSRIPHGLTYLKALSALNNNFSGLYNIYSYAVNNPMEDLDYSLANIITEFDNSEPLSAVQFKNFAKAAAILRASFYHTKDNDFFVASSQIDEEIRGILPSLADVFKFVDAFRSKTGKGMDLYADYRSAVNSQNGNAMEKIRKAAEEMHNRYLGRFFSENINQKRFKLSKALLFAKGKLVDRMLTCVKNNDEQLCKELYHEIMQKFMRTGSVLSASNIEAVKLDEYIDEFWGEAGKDHSIHERKSSQLMGSLRNNLKTPVRNTIEIYCQYYTLLNSKNSLVREDISLYKSLKEDLINALENLKYECETHNLTDNELILGCHIIRAVSKELLKKLRGEWSDDYKKFFFVDFLRTNNILLDEKFMPELSSTFCDLPSFNILSRIRAHIESPYNTIVDYAKEIYSKNPSSHDFGTAVMISEYLEFIEDDGWHLPKNHSEYDEQAKKQLREFYDEFNIYMCAALSMGQIKISDKFMSNIDDVAQYWYQYCLNTSNYGFFLRFVEKCKEKIHNDAKEYEDILKKQLDKLNETTPLEPSTYETVSKHIENHFFTVAEEMMSRISKGDFDSTEDLPLKTSEYIDQFWSEFERNYRLISNPGVNLRRLVSFDIRNKDRKGGQALVDNWFYSGSKIGAEQIKNLLVLLGWSEDITVSEAAINGVPASFLVNEDVHIFNKRQYAHTIAAYGTQAFEDGFYAICILGITNAERLIDLCRRLDSEKGNKILFVDYALTASDRRKLAKRMKQQSFANTYMFVDRVSLIYMANHYRGSGGDDNNRTLLATSIPFTFYQPYTLGSSSSIAPEMFIGRKDELLSVESENGANLIYGGRQLGKSALLKKAKTEVDNRENGRIATFIDIKELDYNEAAKKISRELFMDGIITESEITDNWSDLAFHIKNNIQSKKISYLLLMLDEADCFIESCQDVNFQPLGILKDIQQTMNGKFKFVLAGLHNVIKFKRSVALGQNSVITHLSSINVKPFTYKDAAQLLTEPLGYLGFDFGTDNTSLMQILSATNCFPGLIQLFGHKMVESMKTNYAGYSERNTPGYLVTPEHINKVLADRQFLDEIKEKFEITLRLGEENHYYIIALLLAMLFADNESVEGYDADNIISMAEDIGFDLLEIVSKEHLFALLEELCDLNVLKKVGEYYAFRTKNFRDLLGSKEKLMEDIFAIIGSDSRG